MYSFTRTRRRWSEMKKEELWPVNGDLVMPPSRSAGEASGTARASFQSVKQDLPSVLRWTAKNTRTERNAKTPKPSTSLSRQSLRIDLWKPRHLNEAEDLISRKLKTLSRHKLDSFPFHSSKQISSNKEGPWTKHLLCLKEQWGLIRLPLGVISVCMAYFFAKALLCKTIPLDVVEGKTGS